MRKGDSRLRYHQGRCASLHDELVHTLEKEAWTMVIHGYAFQLALLSKDDGGGWLITFPAFPGAIMSDGETPEEALANGREALEAVIAVYKEDGRELPAPGSHGVLRNSGKFNLRTPRRLHAKLAQASEIEGVSMNTLAVAILAEGLGFREARRKG